MATVVSGVVTSLGTLPQTVRETLRGIAGHIALFQLEIFLAVSAIGGLIGFVLCLAGLTRTLRIAIGTLLSAGLICAQTVARKPALFEDFLWHRGGWRASAQVFVAEIIGPRLLNELLAGIAVALLLIIVWRHRQPRSLIMIAAALLLASMPFWRLCLIDTPDMARLSSCYLRGSAASRSLVVGSVTPEPPALSIDALRKRGAFVKEFLVPIASTIPSWATFMSGVYPHKHGIRDIFPREEQIGLQLPTVPRILAERGYQSVAICKRLRGRHCLLPGSLSAFRRSTRHRR